MRHNEHEIKVFESEINIRRFKSEVKFLEKQIEQIPEETLTWWDNFNATKRSWRQWNRNYISKKLLGAKSRLEYWENRLNELEPIE